MTERLPKVVSIAIHRLGESLRTRIPDTVEAIYVYGSTALNAYIEGSSDIDFLVFVNRTLTPSDIQLIRDAHADIEPGSTALRCCRNVGMVSSAKRSQSSV
ncbi:nucleotidyltransferase domain-containing protein [Paenibacillus sp. GCM10023248]|uniref:nucleotidyltransferase domain-containing protein n=1 Tax=unclassified Paenibacillus TaxID=185978 RepID=UPI002379EBC9|nr:nucleotidyltransferase domain-containing protein [Paenibacillus sp. MAHUQ-63]MDD9271865.1 nucleotidyltransferase domain-containing protein [Paenibacillus sp. MAHUQ-63]